MISSPPHGSPPRPVIRPAVLALALLGGAVVCASALHPHRAAMQRRNPARDNLLATLLGEGRRLFANHAYVKADVYYHRGFYPSAFDDEAPQPSAMQPREGTEGPEDDEHDHATCAHDHHHEPLDWIERHGRAHYPSEHIHLGDGETEGAEREMLPWLLLSSRLDPNLIESYTVGAYWLRRIGKLREAEEFLREGLRANPSSPSLLFELGRCRFDDGDVPQARNLWQAAWQRWRQETAAQTTGEPDQFTANQILLHLAMLESQQGDAARAAEWLETLLPIAIQPDLIRSRIERVRTGEVLRQP